MSEGLPSWVAPALTLGGLAILVPLERLRPLRARVEGATRRFARNVATGGLAVLLASSLELLAGAPAAAWVRAHGLGLLPRLGLPGWADLVLGVLLLDWSLWVWHWLNHRVRFLWRFHLVHHADLDLDASTGLRFHMGELGLSVFYRVGQVAAIGASPLAFSIWQAALGLSVLFHHSNLRLPAALERRLVRLLVTPRMHGIHHSIVREETDSNYASLLPIWDRLHGTLRLGVPQAAIIIGVPACRDPGDVTFGRLQTLPFRGSGDVWRLPDGGRPVRELEVDPLALAE